MHCWLCSRLYLTLKSKEISTALKGMTFHWYITQSLPIPTTEPKFSAEFNMAKNFDFQWRFIWTAHQWLSWWLGILLNRLTFYSQIYYSRFVSNLTTISLLICNDHRHDFESSIDSFVALYALVFPEIVTKVHFYLIKCIELRDNKFHLSSTYYKAGNLTSKLKFVS